MLFQVENNPEGYVVSCFHDDHWHRLRNFGDRQGDAKAFAFWDGPKLSDQQIKVLEKNYDPDKRYIRISSTKFRVQTNI